MSATGLSLTDSQQTLMRIILPVSRKRTGELGVANPHEGVLVEGRAEEVLGWERPGQIVI